MLTIGEAFEKFRTRMEPSDTEEQDAISKKDGVQEHIRESFTLDRDFLAGSYKRWTKTKPLKDIDLFCVLNAEKEKKYLEQPSSVVLEAFRKKLAGKYGRDNVQVWPQCVTVTFIINEDEAAEKVMSIDVVPAFEDGNAYKIPDSYTNANWMKTDPEIHAEKATEANRLLDGKWIPLVKMIKTWNENHGKPVNPSFLLEVMALGLITPPFSGGYKYELKSFFATAESQIYNTWKDPAGYGPPVSLKMDRIKYAAAAQKFQETGRHIDQAILCEKQGRIGDALNIWQKQVFGKRFAIS